MFLAIKKLSIGCNFLMKSTHKTKQLIAWFNFLYDCIYFLWVAQLVWDYPKNFSIYNSYHELVFELGSCPSRCPQPQSSALVLNCHIFFYFIIISISRKCEKLMATHSSILGASPVARMVKNLPAMHETWVWSLGQVDPLEKGMATHSSILAWRIPWIEATVFGVTKNQTRVHN